ncbi:hypothetical protein [Amycolatopsis sp. FDAARGOS 1241]|uniref:hypothetical protein n=1 Tax=Amycolatopsis sp. FDAARGOS 1241 TaxID=2778070 RepID=UPI00194E46F9|nr:hypothetical protein [Amycolatopsis sp. FDAARGOS 1241]QRP42677.1 hypothetical protein I6J71_24585 [Amycolatopsis sp. FDAARGOS 1241]
MSVRWGRGDEISDSPSCATRITFTAHRCGRPKAPADTELLPAILYELRCGNDPLAQRTALAARTQALDEHADAHVRLVDDHAGALSR